MRKCYLICYDIADPKRLGKVFRKMRGFGDHMQLSVFRCSLSDEEKVLLKMELANLINKREDKVMIVDIGPEKGRAKHGFEFLGKQEKIKEQEAVVV